MLEFPPAVARRGCAGAGNSSGGSRTGQKRPLLIFLGVAGLLGSHPHDSLRVSWAHADQPSGSLGVSWYPVLSRGSRTRLDAGQSPPGCAHVATDLRGCCAKGYRWPGANALGIHPCGTETTPVRVPGQRLVHRPPPRRSTPTFGFLPFDWRRVPRQPVKQGHCVVPRQFFRQMPGQVFPSAGGAVGGAVKRSGGKVLVPNLTPVILVGDLDGSSVLPGAAELGVLGSGLRVGTEWGRRRRRAAASPRNPPCRRRAAIRARPACRHRAGAEGAPKGAQQAPHVRRGVEAAIAGSQGWGGHEDGDRFRSGQAR